MPAQIGSFLRSDVDLGQRNSKTKVPSLLADREEKAVIEDP